MAEKNYVKVGGQLQNIVGDGIIAYSKEIKDEVSEKTQEQINTELQQGLEGINEIESLIPAQASSSNQLADKNFVNNQVSTNTANFVGTYNSLAELQEVQNPTNNDYGFVIETDAQGNEYYDRYKYNGSQWLFEYKVESTPFTAEQWAAIQSGITSALVTKLSALPTNAELTTQLNGKQATLVSGTNIKTINNEQILGAGNIEIGGAVDSVNGKTGAVVLDAEDVGAATPAQVQSVANDVATNTQDIATLQAAYEGLTQSDIVPLTSLPASGVANIIYRVAGTDSYTDYMWDGSDFVPMATYSGRVGEGIYDISANNSNASYDNLTAALGVSGANVPIAVRAGGMSIRYLENVYANYEVRITDGLTTEPTGTELETEPSIEEGIYTASQLSGFQTLPTIIDTYINYYVAITEDNVTTYKKWVVTKITDDSTIYTQYRLLSDVWSINTDDWESVSKIIGDITTKDDTIDYYKDKIYIRKKSIFSSVNGNVNTNNSFFIVAINVTGLSDLFIDVIKSPYDKVSSSNDSPITANHVDIIESYSPSTNSNTLEYENPCNWLICNVSNTSYIKFIIGNRLVHVDINGQIPSPSPIRLSGGIITGRTMLEGDILPKLNKLIEGKNLLDPTRIFNGYVQTSTGKVNTGTTNKMVSIENVVLSEWHCFSANENLNLNAYNGVSIYYGSTMVCARPTQNYTPQIGLPNIELVLQPNSNGFKIRVPDFTIPVTLYIGVGTKSNVNLQFEKGENPTAYVPYGQTVIGTDYSTQIAQLSREVNALAAQIDDVKSVPSRWAGCRYAAFGDSITDEHYEPYRKYTTMIAEALNCETYTNYGTSGQTMAKNDSFTNNFIRNINNYNFASFDLVTIMFGTNDCMREFPIGTIGSVDEYTFIGAYSKAIKTMLQANPSLRIVLLTIFQTINVRNQDGSVGAGLDYVNAIKAVGQYYSCPVIDVWSNSGITKENASTYTDGGLHPNAAGHEYAGGYIVAQIKNL